MSKASIFAKIRAAQPPGGSDLRRAAAEARMAAPPAHPLPARAAVTGSELRADFIRLVRATGTTVLEARTPQDVPETVAQYLKETFPGETLTTGSDPWLAALPWGKPAAILRAAWRPGEPPRVALSRAVAGIAESGTLVLASGPDNPATLNYLPEVHIVVLQAMTLKANMEAGLAQARQSSGPRGMPRTLALVSGASRTADVGGKLVQGAHGPRRLAVILVG